jgi:hypothetical protein
MIITIIGFSFIYYLWNLNAYKQTDSTHLDISTHFITNDNFLKSIFYAFKIGLGTLETDYSGL